MTSRVLRHQRSKSDCGLADFYPESNLNRGNNIGVGNVAYNEPYRLPELSFNHVAVTSPNTPSSEFISYVLKVLFTGLPTPDPQVIKALTHDPHCFLSNLSNSNSNGMFLDPLGLPSSADERAPLSHSGRISTTVMRLFSPMRKKSRRLRKISAQQTCRILRPSTASLPAQMFLLNAESGAPRDGNWSSMLQLAMDVANQPPTIQSQSSQHSADRPSVNEESNRIKETGESGVTEVFDNAKEEASFEALEEPSGTLEVTSVSTIQPPPPTTPQSSSSTVQAPQTPTPALDEAQLATLKKNVQRLEAAIKNIKQRKSGE